MDTVVELDVHWALYGKQPGSREDYKILAASALFSYDEFGSIIAHFSPGTPPAQRQSPAEDRAGRHSAGDLPWVILNWAGRDDELQLGLAIQRATSEVDGVGRQIAETSYFCVSFAALTALTEHPNVVSFEDLYQAVHDLSLPRQDGLPITVRVPRLDHGELAKRIASLGEHAVSLVADRVLRGQVSVTRANDSSLIERLRFLDAVAAMLPYGFRTKLAASTWSDSGVRHRMRLAFADRPYSGGEVYQWRTEPVDGTAEPHGYLAQLDRLRGRSAGSLKRFDLEYIVGYLAADTTAQRIDNVKYAVDCLASIDLPFAVLTSVRAGTAEPARVRELFAADRVLELPEMWRVEVLAELVGYGDPADWAVVTRWWTDIAPVDPAALIPALAIACRSQLWTDEPAVDVVDRHIQLAAGHRLTDHLLSLVIAPPDESMALRRGLIPAARLLHKWIMEDGKYEDFPRSLIALADNQVLACELAEQVIVAASRGKTVRIEWLRRSGPALEPFVNLLSSSPAPVSDDMIAALADIHLRCLGPLLRVADHRAHLGQILPSLVWWIGTRPSLEPPARRFLGQLLSKLSPRNIDQQADADLALLSVGYRVAFIGNCTTSQAVRSYARRFAQEWNAVIDHNGDQYPDPFEPAFAQYLDTGQWASNPLSASLIIEIVNQLTGKSGRPRFRNLISSVLNASPDARNWPFAVEWTKRFTDQQAIDRGSRGSLARLPAESPPEQIGTVCYRAYLNEISAKPAGVSLAASEAFSQAPRLSEVLDAVRSVFWADRPEEDRGRLRRLRSAILPSDQDRLRGWLDDMLKAAVTARTRLAEATARGEPARRAPNRDETGLQ